MKVIPKGTVLRCPYCDAKLYGLKNWIFDWMIISCGLECIVGLGKQPKLTVESMIIQRCYKCNKEFNYLDLQHSYLTDIDDIYKKHWRNNYENNN